MNVTVNHRTRHYRTVTFDSRRNAVLLIDQRLLPHQFRIAAQADYRATAGAIRDMVVRGAGAIGATAAYGLAQAARAFKGSELQEFTREIETAFQTLKAARPTAVDPVNAMWGVRRAIHAGRSVPEQQALALKAAEEFADEDVRHGEAIGRHGAKLIRQNARVLTHCNAGWLAFVDVGSATAPLYAAQKAGRKFHVFCDETRPRSQGADPDGVGIGPAKDFPSNHRRQRRRTPDATRRDRPRHCGQRPTFGRTGEVANKIGTYTKAALAHRHGIPFYVAIPLSTIDWYLRCGKDIPIEERAESEVPRRLGRQRREHGDDLRAGGQSRQRRAQPGISMLRRRN